MLRRTLKFFRKRQFKRLPVKVLLTGGFITFLSVSNKDSHHLKELLGFKVTLVTTSCLIKEADMGNRTCEELLKKLKIETIECSHAAKCTELECIISKVGGGNTEDYFVAVNKNAYLERLQGLAMVPVLSSDGKEIALRKQSQVQEDLAE